MEVQEGHGNAQRNEEEEEEEDEYRCSFTIKDIRENKNNSVRIVVGLNTVLLIIVSVLGWIIPVVFPEYNIIDWMLAKMSTWVEGYNTSSMWEIFTDFLVWVIDITTNALNIVLKQFIKPLPIEVWARQYTPHLVNRIFILVIQCTVLLCQRVDTLLQFIPSNIRYWRNYVNMNIAGFVVVKIIHFSYSCLYAEKKLRDKIDLENYRSNIQRLQRIKDELIQSVRNRQGNQGDDHEVVGNEAVILQGEVPHVPLHGNRDGAFIGLNDGDNGPHAGFEGNGHQAGEGEEKHNDGPQDEVDQDGVNDEENKDDEQIHGNQAPDVEQGQAVHAFPQGEVPHAPPHGNRDGAGEGNDDRVVPLVEDGHNGLQIQGFNEDDDSEDITYHSARNSLSSNASSELDDGNPSAVEGDPQGHRCIQDITGIMDREIVKLKNEQTQLKKQQRGIITNMLKGSSDESEVTWQRIVSWMILCSHKWFICALILIVPLLPSWILREVVDFFTELKTKGTQLFNTIFRRNAGQQSEQPPPQQEIWATAFINLVGNSVWTLLKEICYVFLIITLPFINLLTCLFDKFKQILHNLFQPVWSVLRITRTPEVGGGTKEDGVPFPTQVKDLRPYFSKRHMLLILDHRPFQPLIPRDEIIQLCFQQEEKEEKEEKNLVDSLYFVYTDKKEYLIVHQQIVRKSWYHRYQEKDYELYVLEGRGVTDPFRKDYKYDSFFRKRQENGAFIDTCIPSKEGFMDMVNEVITPDVMASFMEKKKRLEEEIKRHYPAQWSLLAKSHRLSYYQIMKEAAKLHVHRFVFTKKIPKKIKALFRSQKRNTPSSVRGRGGRKSRRMKFPTNKTHPAVPKRRNPWHGQ